MNTPLENLPMQAPITVQQEIDSTVRRLRESRIVTIVLYMVALVEVTLRPVLNSKQVKRELTDEGVLYNLSVQVYMLVKKACGYGYQRAVSGVSSLRERNTKGRSVSRPTGESNTKRPGHKAHIE